MKSFRYSFGIVVVAAGLLAVMAGCTAVSPFTYKDEGEDHISLEWKDYQQATSRKIAEVKNDIDAKHELTTQADAQIQQDGNAAQQVLAAVGTVSNVNGPTGPTVVSLIGLVAASLFQDNRRKDQKIAGIKVKRQVMNAASPNGSGTDVQFNLTVGQMSAGQEFYVLGNVTELGNWNPKQAIKMQASSPTQWLVDANLTSDASVEYKYIRLDGAGNVTWEGGSNHTITPSGSSLTISDQWQ